MKSFRTWILIAGILVAVLAINSAKSQDGGAEKDIAKANKESLKPVLKEKHHLKMKSKNEKHRLKERKHRMKSDHMQKSPLKSVKQK